MTTWLNFRAVALFVTLGATLGVLGRILLIPVTIERTPVPVELPGDSQLPGWVVVPTDAEDPTLPKTKRYRRPTGGAVVDLELQYIPNLPEHYVRNPKLSLRFLPHGHLPLDAGMHHYVNSRTMVITNLDSNIPIRASVESREAAPQSAYGIWTAGNLVHLSTIFTPNGDSSMVTRRVARSMYVDHFSAARFCGWLIGHRTLPDLRCVLVHLSVPTSRTAIEVSRQQLEEAWLECRKEFRPVFPD